ncbi:hypothetical protein ACFSSG_08080 [Euzebyella marina]|uniref:hypothetical protein n=1 Tax=Euzebyella marina TaxID=1761453 RepID=UPI0013CF0EC1|nr:hypothetical protein [Euzebyella marina]
MKRLYLFVFVLITMTSTFSCSTDDSNDIDLIKPGDTVITGAAIKMEKTLKRLDHQ